MNKYTPGPWEVFTAGEGDDEVAGVTTRAPEYLDTDGDGADICTMENEGYFGREQMHANARLIAASPELLEALMHVFNDSMLNEGGIISHEAREKAHAAIAKATGGAA